MAASSTNLESTAAAEVAPARAGVGRRSRRGRRPTQPPLPRSAWTRLAACTAAAALLQLDGTVITVALPNVARSLHVANAATAIVLSGYFAAYAVLLFPGGRMVDRLGPRRVAIVGLGVFAVGAAAGALVSDLALLTACRVVQGVGAGLVSPAALAGAVSGFPPDRRGSALGIWGASAGMANLAGPLLGGVLTVAFGWRAAWWALVPLALAAAWGIVRHVPAVVHSEAPPAGGTVLSRTMLVAGVVAGLTFAVMIGSFYLAEQYLQKSAGYSALGASAVLVIVALFVAVAAPVAGVLVDRAGEAMPTMLGFALAGCGLAVAAIPGVSLDGIGTAFVLVPVGLGLGMLFVPVSRAALNSLPDSVHGRASAVLSAARLGGAAVGAGLAGAALAGGATASTVHTALAVAAGACLIVGIPAGLQLGPAARRRSGGGHAEVRAS